MREGNHLCPICAKSGNLGSKEMTFRLLIKAPIHRRLLEPSLGLCTIHPDAVNGADLADAHVMGVDRAVGVCPIGSIIRKSGGFATPLRGPAFDESPVGPEIGGKR